MKRFLTALLLATGVMTPSASAQNAVTSNIAPGLGYADLADLALDAPVAVEARIRRASKITGPQAASAPDGHQRYLIEADVTSVIRASESLPPRLSWLYDAPRDARGKVAKLQKTNVIAFARRVPGKPASLQLSAPDAQIAQTPQYSAQVRAILAAALAADAPRAIAGVGRAFHVPGTLEGEGESQIFLIAADGRPLSFNIVRTPGQAPSWSVSIDEIVDASAARPQRDTLLWYRLACFLPARLPTQSVQGQPPEQARILEEDYRTVIEGLGQCVRQRAGR